MKIAISGIGGVGGYIGGLLAREYHNSQEVEIYFIARGENERVIREKGLQLQTPKGNYTVYPKLVTSDPSLIGPVDLLVSCTKSYDLEENMLQCAPCIDSNTMILPLQNGVDGHLKIESIYPDNTICDGCVYLVSRLAEPGIVKETGHVSKMIFGLKDGHDDRLASIYEVFKKAGIDVTLSDTIESVLWQKFIFISSLASLTSYYDCSIGHIMADPERKSLKTSLLSEIINVAERKNIPLPADIMQTTMDKMAALPFDATSSMHSDFQKGKNTELDSLTGYVISESGKLDIQVPH